MGAFMSVIFAHSKYRVEALQARTWRSHFPAEARLSWAPRGHVPLKLGFQAPCEAISRRSLTGRRFAKPFSHPCSAARCFRQRRWLAKAVRNRSLEGIHRRRPRSGASESPLQR